MKIPKIENIIDIAVSGWHTALLAEDETVWYWGNYADFPIDKYKPLFTPEKSDLNTWYMVKGNDERNKEYKAWDSGFDIYNGIHEQLSIKHDGTVWFSTYEHSYDYELGYVNSEEEFTELKEFFGARDVAINNDSYFIVCADGTIVSKGGNYSGQLGNGFSDSVAAPVKLDGINNVKKVCSTVSWNDEDYCYYLLYKDGTVSMLSNDYYENSLASIPLENISDIVANEYKALALKDDGTVWTWDVDSQSFNVKKIEELNDIVSVFTTGGGPKESLTYGAIDKNGDFYLTDISDIGDYLGGLLEQEAVTDGTFGKITKIKDNNESVQYMNFGIYLDGVKNTANLSLYFDDTDCTFPLPLINSEGYFMRLLRQSIDDLSHVFSGGNAGYACKIKKEDDVFVCYSEKIHSLKDSADSEVLTDVGCDFMADNSGSLYYAGSITKENYRFFPNSPYGYQRDWEKVASAVVTLQIDSNIIYNNNTKMQIPASPIIINNRTLVPIREVVENLGGQVIWDDETKSTGVIMGEYNLNLPIGSLEVSVNGKTTTTDAAPQIIDNKTYLPLRLVCENIGTTVHWEPVTSKITIIKQ